MSQQKVPSNADGLSLKVLRLSRPSLSHQTCIPPQTSIDSALHIPSKASLSHPREPQDSQFILSPLLTLPPAFGSAYVGETFSCTLCANNELPTTETQRVINAVKLVAEMQTPSQTVPLDLIQAEDDNNDETNAHPLTPGTSLQRIVRFDLKEEGRHILAVRVNFQETLLSAQESASGEKQAAGGRARTFRKLYQFEAQPCLNVRTKITPIERAFGSGNTKTGGSKESALKVAVEAQLEHVGEGAIVLENITMTPSPPFTSTSLNRPPPTPQLQTLHPRDITQVAFLLTQQTNDLDGMQAMRKHIANERVALLGQLGIAWRSAMGDRGFLSTGLLTLRRP